jgi:L-xylulokinase
MQRLLPPLVRSTEICGRVSAAAAAETGLAEGTPVAAGLFDIDACGLASGLIDERQLCMVAGTWGINQYISTRPVEQGVFMTSCYAIPGYYLMLEGSPTSASNLEWFVSEFFAAEREQASQQGQSVWDLCNELVAATRPSEAQIVFLPFVWGSNVNPNAQGALVGLQGWHQRGHVLRAIYEGVVFSHRHHVERLMQFRKPPERVCLTGGAARSPVWREIFADCLGLPVEAPAGTELGALGAAIAAAVAAGCYADFPTAVGRMVRVAGVQTPHPERKSLYDDKYARYQRVIAALDSAW